MWNKIKGVALQVLGAKCVYVALAAIYAAGCVGMDKELVQMAASMLYFSLVFVRH